MMYWTFSSQCIVGIWSLTLVHNLEHTVQWWIICCGGYCHWSHFTSLSIDLFFCLFSHFGFYFFLHLEIPKCFASKLCIPKNCWASGMSCITTHLLFCDPIWIQCQESHNRAQMSSSLLLLQCTQPFRDALSLLTVEYHKIQIYLVKKITPYTNSSNYLIVTGQHQLVSEPVHCSDYPNILKSTIPLSLRTEHEVNHQKNLYSQQIQCSTCKLFGYCQYFLVQTSNGKVCTHESFLEGWCFYGQDHNILKSPLKNEWLMMLLSVLLPWPQLLPGWTLHGMKTLKTFRNEDLEQAFTIHL